MKWACLAAAAAMLQPAVLVEHEPMHRVVFENALVRVIDASVPAGQATAYHTHERDNVPVAVAAGRIAVTPRGGHPAERPVPLGQVSYAVGGYTHEVRNAGDSAVRFIDVELRGPRGVPTGGRLDTRGHVAEIETDRVIVHRLRVPPGGRVASHHHGGPLLEVVVRGERVARGSQAPEPPPPGSFAWRGDGQVPAIENAGDAEFELVEIEWKP